MFIDKLNDFVSTINHKALMVLLCVIPIGICYRIYQLIQLRNTEMHGEWTGVVLLFLVAAELYLFIMIAWLKAGAQKTSNNALKLIQLLLIFVLGVLPGISAIYPAFIKN